ncbi:hypothetical protein [Sphingobium lignivorans]|uniref:Uncharacterized protein n=1 Tax=Sphingobium lignivorans TaxID=2735886 RepID=A0ABR6NGF9_9SPHN|nr:hypothetical protein [Sphingobium lignivorans]MBB5986166.1 hypothetical protein [Sphingobium lignivorans]
MRAVDREIGGLFVCGSPGGAAMFEFETTIGLQKVEMGETG